MALSSMGADLAINELEAILRIGDLLAEAAGEFGEEVAVFAGGGFGVEVELGDLTGEQRAPLAIEGSDVAFGVADLTHDAEELGGRAFTSSGDVDLAMIVKETLESFGVAAAVGQIGAGHQKGEVLLLGVVAREVGVDALGDLTEESLEAGRRIELFGFAGIPERGIMGLLCALAGLLGPAAGGVGAVKVDFSLGDARFDVVKLGVEDAYLAEVTAFEALELGAELGKLRFTLGEPGANGSKLLAFVKEVDVVRSLLEDDFGWHAASREWSF
jgi:hypothetical protein